MEKHSEIYVAGHNGMVGRAIVRELLNHGYTSIITKSLQELDLTRQTDVEDFFKNEKPEYVFVAAAVVGGILANNTQQARFLLENMQIQNNLIGCAYKYKVKKLLFLGSSCIYPAKATQPIDEKLILSGPLELTNEGYAIAKIAGIKLCEYLHLQQNANFISLMPCNLFGYYDNFDLQTSHFLPALIRKFYDAKTNNDPTVIVWGTGKPKRELLFVDDLAKACLYAMDNYNEAQFLNVGYGCDYTIAEYAQKIKNVSGYKGKIIFDTTKPDGMERKLMDSQNIRKLGWEPKVELDDAIKLTYEWYANNHGNKE